MLQQRLSNKGPNKGINLYKKTIVCFSNYNKTTKKKEKKKKRRNSKLKDTEFRKHKLKAVTDQQS